MRVIVCGGRDFADESFVWAVLDRYHAQWRFTAFMQGGHWSGVDLFAKQWARAQSDLDGRRFECRARWTELGRAAGPIRNSRMLEWLPNAVIGFPGGTGTADMIAKASAVDEIIVEEIEYSLHMRALVGLIDRPLLRS